jgi:hypothetical protein
LSQLIPVEATDLIGWELTGAGSVSGGVVASEAKGL